jgi:hypothetical protein
MVMMVISSYEPRNPARHENMNPASYVNFFTTSYEPGKCERSTPDAGWSHGRTSANPANAIDECMGALPIAAHAKLGAARHGYSPLNTVGEVAGWRRACK